MSASSIARALNGRRSGSGWVACCPAHQDRTPSLSIRDSDDKILIHCFAGCTQNNVVAALRERGLWPERERRGWSYAERSTYARRRARAEVLAQRALRWRAAIVSQVQQAKAAAYAQFLSHPNEHAEKIWADAAQRLYWHETLRGMELAREYKLAKERDAVSVERLIAASLEDEAHAKRCAAVAVNALALAIGGAH